MGRSTIIAMFAFSVICCCFSKASNADLFYNIVPQLLEHETDYTDEHIYGGEIRMVDGADLDGILQKSELLEVTVYNSLAGTVHAYDEYDFSMVNATFVGNELRGQLRVQHTDSGEAFTSWDDSGFVVISSDVPGANNKEYAKRVFESPKTIAVRAVPEPSGMLAIAGLLGLVLAKRRRRLVTRRQDSLEGRVR